ncbi:MAG: aminotransferase class V-fold PLP-dependent enzyme [Candidatus Hydrogenedentes bacterium]|nr:aminotransferase class V-fold PLP-dependent enzyme [Candidatus Hydrogenedentota bacterium]
MATTLPEQGVPHPALLDAMQEMARRDVAWKEHRAFGLVYDHSEAHSEFVRQAHNLFMATNGLNPMAFQSLQRMEHEVVRITADLLHGDDSVVGTMTSGGTESLLLAVLTYRQHARKHRPWVRRPEIVLPESAHAAFFKAGEYFDVKMIPTPLQKDFRADVDAMARAITRNTIAVVGSAACYPYGVVDPIADIAALGQSRGLPVHVDGCIGGFLLPFVEQLGSAHQIAPIAPFDFRVPGVTSMSADVHKYGYAAKGASVIVYRGMDYLRYQFSAATDWCGGVYASPTLAGTRPGGAIAAAWGALHALGRSGYVENAKGVMVVTKRFYEGINAIPELEVLGKPAMSIIAYGARIPGLSTYAVGDQLEARKWHIDRLQRPESLHMILNPGHAEIVDSYLDDLREAVAYVKDHPDTAFEGSAPLYGLIAKAPMRRLVKRQVLAIVEKMYSAEGGIPDLSAPQADAPTTENVSTPPALPPLVVKAMKVTSRLKRLFR